MKNLKYLLLGLLLIPASSNAEGFFDHATGSERIATFVFFAVTGLGLVVAYLVYKNQQLSKQNKEKYRVKTFEVVQNGRRIIMTKKYKVVDEKQFPKSVRRK